LPFARTSGNPNREAKTPGSELFDIAQIFYTSSETDDLTDMVVPKQRLLMQNTQSGENQECRMISVKKELVGPANVAVEFTRPAPSFWHLTFPPADWAASV
jgi:hypothetical protein